MYLLALFIIFVAAFISFYSGFGLGTIILPALVLILPVSTAIALTALIHLLSNLLKMFILRPFVNWRVVISFGLPALLAAFPGAWLLLQVTSLEPIYSYQILNVSAQITPIKMMIGIFLILFVLIELVALKKHVSIAPKYMGIGGLLSGFFGGISGHQGAIRSLFLLHAEMNHQSFVATSAAIAIMVDIARILVYGLNFSLILADTSLSFALAVVCAALFGIILGRIILKKVTIIHIQRLVSLSACLIGIFLVTGLL